MSELFTPLQVGELSLPNRIILAPLTRTRAEAESRVPTELMAEYYAQRASAGLLITEATSIHPMGVGYPRTPGIWSEEQVQGWRKVTDAVHAKNGRIFLQLWHVGRISHPAYLEGEQPVAPSAIAAEGHVRLLRPHTPHPVPRPLETAEIHILIDQYRKAAENAQRAGFDGVELHAANGYLIDQFLQDSANKRDDAYGGSIENRTRLLLEVTDTLIDVWGAGRVGVHLAPRGDDHSMGDSNREALFTHVARELGKRNIAFIFTREYRDEHWLTPKIKQAFGGVCIANEGFTLEEGNALVKQGGVDAIGFGKLYIANPDLVERFTHHLPLNSPDFSTFYSEGEKGYTDYPAADVDA